MKKNWTRFLVVLLTLALVFPLGALAAEDPPINVFSVEAAEGVRYDGYLVSVRPGVQPRISPVAVGMEEVVVNLYLADTMEDIQQVFRADQIVFIEPNYEIVPLGIPNDPLLDYQWALAFLDASALWRQGLTGAGVRLAIIDSGITLDHEDLDPRRVAPGFNFLDNNTDVRDNLGHGTRVAGIVVATRDNGRGMTGLLSEVTIVPLKVMDPGRGLTSHAVQAIKAAANTFDVDVINMSFGIPGGGVSQALNEAVDYALARGLILVAAAGNYGDRPAEANLMIYPAAHPGVVSVAAIGRNGRVVNFSQRNRGLTVAAPGSDLVTIDHRNRTAYHMNVCGTSYASPHVAAMAVVARSLNPDITSAQFMDLLRQSAVNPGPGNFNDVYGYGVVNINRFLNSFVWFNDIDSVRWARESILYMAERNLLNGVGDGAFAPNQPTSRAMFVTVLGRIYREAGGHIPVRNDNFVDTRNDSWYSRYVAWAAEQGIVYGFRHGNQYQFRPSDPVTREQAATFLARFAVHVNQNSQGHPSGLDNFLDGNAVAGWATEAMAWVVEEGIITGINTPDGTALQPQENSTRAQVAVIMQRFIGNTPALGNVA